MTLTFKIEEKERGRRGNMNKKTGIGWGDC